MVEENEQQEARESEMKATRPLAPLKLLKSEDEEMKIESPTRPIELSDGEEKKEKHLGPRLSN